MSDTLRDRIAAVIQSDRNFFIGLEPQALALADAVIRELELREETVAFANGPLNGFKGGPYDGCTGNGVNRRYVTQWERR